MGQGGDGWKRRTPWKMPRGPSEILLRLICRTFCLLSLMWKIRWKWLHYQQWREYIVSPSIAVPICVPSPVCIASLGAAAVERHCLATSLSPPSEGDSCGGGQKTFGFRWAGVDVELSKVLIVCEWAASSMLCHLYRLSYWMVCWLTKDVPTEWRVNWDSSDLLNAACVTFVSVCSFYLIMDGNTSFLKGIFHY